MSRNAYAKKVLEEKKEIKAAKVMLTEAQKMAVINRTISILYYASAVTLNEEFGFGKERIVRFRDGVYQLFKEYKGLLDNTDVDYAEGKLAQRYEAIMGEDAYIIKRK